MALFPPVLAAAAVTETFDGIVDASYGTPDDYGAWFATNSMTATNNARGGSGKCLVFDDDAGAYLLYEGSDGNGKDGGLGTVSFWYCHWNGDGSPVKFQVEYRQGAGSWFALGSEVAVSSTTHSQFTADANVAGDDIQVRVRSTAYGERLCLDDVSLGDMSGPAEDPNLNAPSSIAFGAIAPGTASTQILALANSGATLPLHLTSLSPASGDTSKFTASPIPASLAPGISTNIRVVYAPGAVTGASHSATFNLLTDDPTTPTHPIVFSGSTFGAALSVSNIQYSASGASPQAGNRVTVSGIATYADPKGYAIADAGGGPWSGIFVADVYHRPDPGDQVRLNALVQEVGAFTLLTNVTDYVVLATNQPTPLTAIRGNQLGQEAYEGVLVRITNVVVRNTNWNNGRVFWQAGDGSSNFLVGTRAPYRYIWSSNATLSAIQGLVFTNFIQPRFDADFVGRPVFEYALRGMVMTPDGPRTNWYVQVEDDVIVAVTNAQPAGVAVVDTGGIIYPGLIDAHNHPAYNSFPTLMLNNFPYGHRDEWGEYDDEYDDWKAKRTTLRSAVGDTTQDVITKYGECLELMAGCIAIQGQSNSDAEHSHPDVILYNVEQFPSRVYANIFPWWNRDEDIAARATLRAKIAGGAVNASMIHLCEGPDATSLAQFYTWSGWGLLDGTTAIIHGTPLGPTEFAQMAAVGAKLLWSPMSNMKLYGSTANVKAAKAAGVTVGLSPDWTPSGCFNMLEELGYAWELNTTIFSNAFTAREMADMVTINNAKCAGLDHRYGKIAIGYNAGLCVIEGDIADPYMSLIRARPPQVLLTIVDGTPRYGEPALMTALGVTGETVDVRGRTKKMNIAVVHPFLEYSQRTFAQLQSTLRTGHAGLSPVGELDRDELQFLDLAFLQDGPVDDVAPFRADNPLSSAPSTTVTNDVGGGLSLAFRYQDFWDNDTFITNLTHTISIAPARYSNLLVQTIATNRPNTVANQNVNFTVGFRDMHTNYVFVFETRDAQGNVRTTVSTNSFKVKTYAGGDTDRDGMPNEWEIAYFGGFSNALATANLDNDWLNNFQEYVANTLPNNPGSVLSEDVPAPIALGNDVWELQSPEPTSTGRVYDVWRTTNLMGQIVWTQMNLNVRGTLAGTAVVLRVTNALPAATYRTGVKLLP
ncbi:MAG: amidohydrolase family protein [Kiritimatiellia bacterium]